MPNCGGFESRHSPQFRSIAQPGSAPGLGPGGRRFESYCSDHILDFKRKSESKIPLN